MSYSFVRKHSKAVSIVVFIIVFIIIVNLKPGFLFNKNGMIRKFGLGKMNCTIVPLWLFVIVIAILSYLVINYYVKFT